MITSTDVVVIGAGQAGLSTSRCLGDLGICHVVLERGRIAQRWRAERWNSLRLLTPNWMTRLPGHRYDGDDPDGFLRARDVADMLTRYAGTFCAPVLEGLDVKAVDRREGRFRVATTHGEIRCRGVVIATGHCDEPAVPRAAAGLTAKVGQIVPKAYKAPGDLPEGGVLVVGASATGVQLAEELHQSGRPVTLAVGRHTRLPRRYRGRDIMRWLDEAGVLDEPLAVHAEPASAHRQTSLQLVGSADGRDVGLASLAAMGVRLAGRVAAVEGSTVHFGPDLHIHAARADAKMRRLLARIDDHITGHGALAASDDIAPFAPDPGPDRLDLEQEGIRSVVWATGFRRHYGWLKLSVFDSNGEIEHSAGVTRVPGLCVVGMPFQSRRKSTFIDGVGADAAAVARHLLRILGGARDAA